MRVETLTTASGLNFNFRPGQTLNLPDDEAEILIKAGAARLLPGKQKVVAAKPAVEEPVKEAVAVKAVSPTPRKSGLSGRRMGPKQTDIGPAYDSGDAS